MSNLEAMPLILRAIITGFGYKIGAELGRYVAEKIGFGKKKDKSMDDEYVPRGMDENAPPDQQDGDKKEDDEEEEDSETNEAA